MAKQQLLLKSAQEAHSCHSLLIRAELVVSGLKGQRKPGHSQRPCGEGVLPVCQGLAWGGAEHQAALVGDTAWGWVAQEGHGCQSSR